MAKYVVYARTAKWGRSTGLDAVFLFNYVINVNMDAQSLIDQPDRNVMRDNASGMSSITPYVMEERRIFNKP